MNKLPIVLLAVLVLAVPALAVDPGTNAPPLNVSQYSSMPPPQEAEVKISASTQPIEEGKPPPRDDVSVKIPMWQTISPVPLPQPKLDDDKGFVPSNVYEILVTLLVVSFILAAAFPRMREIFSGLFKKKSNPPPPAV